jgi:micrococcal nuclease
MYTYEAFVNRVIDGDSLELAIDLGFRVVFRSNCRLVGVDAPETWRPRSDEERLAGERVAAFLNVLVCGRTVLCKSARLDKFGRPLVELVLNGASVNDAVNAFMREHSLEQFRFR